MSIALRIASAVALAACAWQVADGVARAGAFGTSIRPRVPWDADRLPELASDAEVLALRPVSPFARLRDAFGRADSQDGEGFRTAGRGVLRWGRGEPGTLLALGKVAMARWARLGEAEDLRLGEDLLTAFMTRTTGSPVEGLEAWLEHAPADADPFATFRAVPRGWWSGLGVALEERRPEAAWKFLEASVLDGTVDAARAGAAVVRLARDRHDPRDRPVLEALDRGGGLSEETARAVRALLSRPVGD